MVKRHVAYKYTNRLMILILTLILGIMLCNAVSASGLADSPQPKFHNDLNNTGQSLYNGSKTNTTKWNYTTGERVCTSPSIGSDGTIYVGSYDHNFYALNPNGTQKWNYTTGGLIYSSPAIGSDGTIYFGSEDKNLYALNPNGTLKWKYATGNWVYSSPSIGNDGTVYFGSNDGNLYALHSDGTLKWKYTTIWWGSVESCPAIDSDGIIYFGSNNYLYALNPNGTLKWNYNTGAPVMSPAIGSGGTIYFGNWNGDFYALNSNGTLKWKYATGTWIYPSPAISNDGTIYFGSRNGNFYALNPDGTLKWKYTTAGEVDADPSIGGDGTIYFESSDNNLYALNPDGTLKWKYYGNGPTDLTIGSDGTLYFGNGHNLTAIQHIFSVVSIDPANNAVNVPVNKAIKVTFSDSIKMGNGLIELKDSSGSAVAFTTSIDGNTLTITPINVLNKGIEYTLTLYDGSVTDLAGNSLEFYSNSFIVDNTSPIVSANQTNGISNSSISINLSSEPDATIHYKINDGSWYTFTGSGTVLISDTGTNTLEFYAVDAVGNPSDPITYTYVIDKTAPVVTANPEGVSLSKNPINVTLSSEPDATIYYTTDGANWSHFTGSGNVSITNEGTTSLEFYAVDVAGNLSNHTTYNYTIDKTAPTANASVKSGLYNINKTIYLTMSEPGSIYYTLNGSTPIVNSTRYNGSIIISSTTILKFIAVDKAGNQSSVYTQKYTIDKIAPKVISTYPKNYTTGFSRTATISIKFSENIKASINWSKIYMKNLTTGKLVSISKWISGNTLYIKMSSRRYAYNWYQIYIPRAAVKDYAGNNLAAGYTLKFKTGRY